jgi:(p)ppGpp synthase/HD superfamily hydrolase
VFCSWMFIAVEASVQDRTLRHNWERRKTALAQARLQAEVARLRQDIEQTAPRAGKHPLVQATLDLCALQPDANRALQFAFEKLAGKNRGPTDEPRILHALRVTGIVVSLFQLRDRQTVLTALLHDMVEDSEATAEEIAALFGHSIADAVELLTKPTHHPKPERCRIHREAVAAASDSVVLVKLADYYDNLQSRRGLERVARTTHSAESFIALLTERRRSHLPTRSATRRLEALLATLREEQFTRSVPPMPL